MVKVIRTAISLNNAPPMTAKDLYLRAQEWADVLFGVIPGDALEACCRKAFADYMRAKDGGTYPLNAYHLKLAYDEIKKSAGFVESSRTLTTDERVAQCSNRGKHLADRFGEVKIFIPGITEDEMIVPCALCRKEDFHTAKAQILAGRKEPTFEEAIAAVAE